MPEIPPRLKQILHWLPVDSETLFVANGPFHISARPSEEPNAKPTEDPPFLEMVQSLSFGIAATVQEGLLGKQLQGHKIMIGVEASRRFTSPKGLGMMPYEGCQILEFDDGADGALQMAVESCLEKAPMTILLGGTKVAAFTEKWENDEWSLFVARPQRGVLLCATNRNFLEQVLAQMNREHQDCAFPDDLPEWRHVNVAAPVWAVRHYRKDTADTDPSSPLRSQAAANFPDREAVGFVFWFDGQPERVAKVHYLSGAKDAAVIATKGWHFPSEKLTPTIKEIEPGVIEISSPVADDDESRYSFLFMLTAYLGHAVYV